MNTDSVSGSAANMPMATAQWGIVGLCMLFNLIDGLDVMAMAFTAGSVAEEWSLNGVQTGMLLSAGLVGMACGSIVAAPIAVRHGRHRLLVISLLLSGVGMLISFKSPGIGPLLSARFMTGIGVGVMLVMANVLTYEHASPDRRGLAVALQSMAFALGAVLCGALAHGLNDTAGWRYVFLTGGCITLGAAVIAACCFRESRHGQAFSHDTRERPLHGEDPPRMMRKDAYRLLFSAEQWQKTASLALAFFLLMFGFYFVMSWTPTLLMQSGFSEHNGAAGGMLLNAGGMLGALTVGLGANRFGCRQLLLGCLLLNTGLMAIMVPVTQVPGLSIAAGCLAGLLLNGAVAALYNLTAQAFTAPLRTSGVGLVLATARLGAILSPAVAGLLLDSGWTHQGLFTFYAGSQLLASLLLWFPGRRA
ncbi:MFS transporter [Pseudomonas abietaniphila]|uniref:Predicted arabinose efflux permease, MFS family n=1 Tax=Pseudomonas abietaniphila TaxID=89065 RepID=A0A1G7RNW9_9PSED|nr:MFS transporter [Pseudomonas abietaniphila]SDG12451.1 Predicted arabinose efflux permease, MFS family [Pseudomonas abietaniphila]